MGRSVHSFAVTSWVAVVLLGLFAPSAPQAQTPASPAFSLFPEATRVHVYGAPTSIRLSVDDLGRVTAWRVPPDGEQAVQTPVTDGGWLTAGEIAEVRAAVRSTPPPDWIAACCDPRHTFLFYDEQGRYLGHFSVCFECGCVELLPDQNAGWIDWNRSVFASIVKAHHLGPLAPRR